MSHWLDFATWTPILEKFGLSPDDWFPVEYNAGFVHWSGIHLSFHTLNSDPTEFLRAIGRYVARLPAENIAHRKQLFVGYKEARQFIVDMRAWLAEHIEDPSDDASIAVYIKNPHSRYFILYMQLTDAVPKALRDRLAQAKEVHEAWEASNIPFGSLIQYVRSTPEGGLSITYDFAPPDVLSREEVKEFAQKMGTETWELKITNGTPILWDIG